MFGTMSLFKLSITDRASSSARGPRSPLSARSSAVRYRFRLALKMIDGGNPSRTEVRLSTNRPVRPLLSMNGWIRSNDECRSARAKGMSAEASCPPAMSAAIWFALSAHMVSCGETSTQVGAPFRRERADCRVAEMSRAARQRKPPCAVLLPRLASWSAHARFGLLSRR